MKNLPALDAIEEVQSDPGHLEDLILVIQTVKKGICGEWQSFGGTYSRVLRIFAGFEYK